MKNQINKRVTEVIAWLRNEKGFNNEELMVIYSILQLKYFDGKQDGLSETIRALETI